MTFTKLNLSGDRALIKGTDSQGVDGETVVSTAEWNEVKRRTQMTSAHKDFDRVVEEFFAPIVEAAEKLHVELDQTEQDESSFIVLDEGEEATAGRRRSVISLSRDSIVLRLIEEGHDNRLVWVNGDLEVLASEPTTPTPTVAEVNEGDTVSTS